MILITGATGHLGKATIQFLLAKGYPANQITALVRDEQKGAEFQKDGIKIKVGDYNDFQSLAAAFEGADKVLLISGTDVANRSKQQENVVNAAKAAGVKHILYTSFERKNETAESPMAFLAESHLHTESLIKASGLDYTILRNNLYLDALPLFIGDQFTEQGVFFAAGDTAGAFASRLDMAEATANILSGEGHESKTYLLSNTENISFPEIAGILSELTGKKVAYVSPEPAVFLDNLVKAGVPQEYTGLIAGTADAIREGEFYTDQTDLDRLLGRKPTSAKEFLTGFYKTR
ncbi:SDR family oxidoreductase [Mucilaginibacter gossypii]|uniref:NAD(P)H dehydrogenase (Quinone) n=1 Tax=Mucilaginibacter gossypii TaxID=551996 RepID=A0A1G8CR13_9SPHI|nr:SDR family oxidoreductase [Mucilaginibacter gossypii]SDH47629.1 NAD(P)H dehydrogenase (quinone) [Mucilaginibacter gossypii]